MVLQPEQELRREIFYMQTKRSFGRKLPSDSLFSRLWEKRFRSTVNYLSKIRKQKLTLNVKRDIIPLSSVDASLMINKTTAYIKSIVLLRLLLKNLEKL
jgi:carboxyl-terminal processing protease